MQRVKTKTVGLQPEQDTQSVFSSPTVINEEGIEFIVDVREIEPQVSMLNYVIKNDTNSKNAIIQIDRFFDNIDLSTKELNIAYSTAFAEEGLLSISKDYMEVFDNHLLINWWIPSNVTVAAGIARFQIRFFSRNESDRIDYMWQTAISTFNIGNNIAATEVAPLVEYTQERAFEISNRERETWTTIFDYDLPIDIKNRTIGSIPQNVVLRGDSNSQVISFTMPRYLDGVDLSRKVISIKYVNANGENDRSHAINQVTNENTIVFSWLISSKFTISSGIALFAIEILGYNYPYPSNDPVNVTAQDLPFFYVWQTLPVRVTIEQSLYIDGSIPLPNPEWEAIWQVESQAILDAASNVENDKVEITQMKDSVTSMKNETIDNLVLSELAAENASQSEEEAENHALLSQQWAIGTSDAGTPTPTHNAKYYAEQAAYNVGDKGYFSTTNSLYALYPNNIVDPGLRNGWHCIVGETDTIWVWDADANAWTDAGRGASDYEALSNKPAIEGRTIYDNSTFLSLNIPTHSDVTDKVTLGIDNMFKLTNNYTSRSFRYEHISNYGYCWILLFEHRNDAATEIIFPSSESYDIVKGSIYYREYDSETNTWSSVTVLYRNMAIQINDIETSVDALIAWKNSIVKDLECNTLTADKIVFKSTADGSSITEDVPGMLELKNSIIGNNTGYLITHNFLNANTNRVFYGTSFTGFPAIESKNGDLFAIYED